MLGVFLNSALDGVDGGFRLTQAFTKKSFEFLLGDGDISFIFHLLLILLPAKQDDIFDKGGNK